MGEGRRGGVALGTAAAGGLLLLAAPTPAGCLETLSRAGSATDQAAPLVALLALLGWALAGWLALTVLLTAGGHLPGHSGRGLRALARRVAPAVVRRGVEVALGLVVVGTLASPAAAAAGAEPSPSAGRATATAPDLDWPTAPSPAGPSRVVVRAGDTLWDLAEQELRGRGAAGPTGAGPTDAEVAAAWPVWWATNREAVGDDPHLLRPGTPLVPPLAPRTR